MFTIQHWRGSFFFIFNSHFFFVVLEFFIFFIFIYFLEDPNVQAFNSINRKTDSSQLAKSFGNLKSWWTCNGWTVVESIVDIQGNEELINSYFSFIFSWLFLLLSLSLLDPRLYKGKIWIGSWRCKSLVISCQSSPWNPQVYVKVIPVTLQFFETAGH